MTKEIRVIAGMAVEQRAEDEAQTLVGYAAVFDQETDIGGQFREVVRKGAFADALGRDDIHALFNHDYGNVIGRKKAGTLRIAEDDKGLRVEITPPNTQLARDLIENIRAGNIDQMSFAFSMQGGKQEWDETGDVPVRSIQKVGELFEVSVVPRGAYPTTEIGLRSLEEHRKAEAVTGYGIRKARMRMNLALSAQEGRGRAPTPEPPPSGGFFHAQPKGHQMSTIKELREQQARIATNARAKFDEITAATDESRAAEIEREFDAMMADHDKIGAKIERALRLEKAESLLRSGDPRAPRGADGEARGVDDGERMDYRTAFHAYMRAQGNIGAMDAEARAVLAAGYKTIEQRAQTTSATAGGYTVPTELLNILVKSMAAWGPMYDENVATVITTTGGGTLTMPTVNDTAVTAEAHTEGATLTDDGGKDATFGQKTLGAYAFNTEWLRVSKELADDSIMAMEQVLGDLLGERLGRIANSKLTTGSGSSDVLGIVTGSTLGRTTAGTTAITSDEIIDLLHSVDPAYRMSPKAAFMFNDSTLAAIRKLKDGDGNYLWQMGNVQQGTPGTLLGYRYYINQAMASIPGSASATRVMIFGDLGKFYVRKVGAPLIGAIQDKDFWPGFGVAGYIRFDGELADTAAVKHLITAAA